MSSFLSITQYRRPVVFHMGDVLVRTWQVFARHLLTFLLLSSISVLPPIVLEMFLPGVQQGRLSWTAALIGVLSAILSSLVPAMVVYAAFQDLRGRKVTAFESMSQAFSRLLAVIGVSILVVLIVGLGTALLIIPGMIALASLAVALPACVVEQLGPTTSLTRSRDLTEGHRWPIFGVAIAIALAGYLGGWLIGSALASTNLTTVRLAAALWQILLLSFQSVYAAILYHDLRAVSEGIGIEEIASVFD